LERRQQQRKANFTGVHRAVFLSADGITAHVSLRARVEPIARAVAREIEGDDHRQDDEARKGRDPVRSCA